MLGHRLLFCTAVSGWEKRQPLHLAFSIRHVQFDRPVRVHTLRHSFATQLPQSGYVGARRADATRQNERGQCLHCGLKYSDITFQRAS
jgi:integrase